MWFCIATINFHRESAGLSALAPYYGRYYMGNGLLGLFVYLDPYPWYVGDGGPPVVPWFWLMVPTMKWKAQIGSFYVCVEEYAVKRQQIFPKWWGKPQANQWGSIVLPIFDHVCLDPCSATSPQHPKEGTSHVFGHSRQQTLKDVESCAMLLQKITEAGEGGRVLQELQVRDNF